MLSLPLCTFASASSCHLARSPPSLIPFFCVPAFERGGQVPYMPASTHRHRAIPTSFLFCCLGMFHPSPPLPYMSATRATLPFSALRSTNTHLALRECIHTSGCGAKVRRSTHTHTQETNTKHPGELPHLLPTIPGSQRLYEKRHRLPPHTRADRYPPTFTHKHITGSCADITWHTAQRRSGDLADVASVRKTRSLPKEEEKWWRREKERGPGLGGGGWVDGLAVPRGKGTRIRLRGRLRTHKMERTGEGFRESYVIRYRLQPRCHLMRLHYYCH